MKRGLCYLLVLFGIVLVVSSASNTSAYSFSLEMETDITDAYYTNTEPTKSKLDDDVIIKFTQTIDFKLKYYDDEDEREDEREDDEDEREDESIKYKYLYKIEIILKIQLILPSGYSFNYVLSMIVCVSEGNNIFDATLFMYNHALESGWYEIRIGSYIKYSSISAYDNLIFDPPGGSDGADPPQIELVY